MALLTSHIAKLIIPITFLFLACNSTDSEDAGPAIANGLYQHAETIDGVSLTLQVDLKASQDYAARGYIGGLSGCSIFEQNGKWALEGAQLKTSSANYRERANCTATFSAWASSPDKSEEVRNITPTSFEIYQAADAEAPAQWVKYTKI